MSETLTPEAVEQGIEDLCTIAERLQIEGRHDDALRVWNAAVKVERVATAYLAMADEIERLRKRVEAADRIEALTAERDALAEKLKDIEAVMVRRIKSARLAKDMAASGNSKQREHHRMHALSEALGEIRKITGETDG